MGVGSINKENIYGQCEACGKKVNAKEIKAVYVPELNKDGLSLLCKSCLKQYGFKAYSGEGTKYV